MERNNTEQWNRNYKDVLTFAEAHGHLKIPSNNHEMRRLAAWLGIQSKRVNIPSCQSKKLKALEPYRDMRSRGEREKDIWNEMYGKLRTFHDATGHFVVPMDVDKSLNKWIVYQRQRARIGKLSEERREKLEVIDFEFQCYGKKKETSFSAGQVKQWETMYEQLVEFHRHHNHYRVPYQYDKNPTLGHWVSKHRVEFKNGVLDPGRKARLDRLGFAWTLKGVSRR
jgi:hypothetical protein